MKLNIIATPLLFFCLLSNVSAENNYFDKHRYVIINNGADVFDKETGLIWARCSVGQKWASKNGCVGAIERFTWSGAQLLDNGDWRVPTIAEYNTLINADRDIFPTTFTEGGLEFSLTNMRYWSSTQLGGAYACYVSFGDGFYYVGDSKLPCGRGQLTSENYAVRLVRTGNSRR